MMPGPSEPTPVQLNHILEPLVKELWLLKNGVSMDIHGEEEPENVFGDIMCTNCDTPAAQCLSGQAGHSADLHPCPYCSTVMLDINKVSSYGDGDRTLKDDEDLLYYAFQYHNAPTAHQKPYPQAPRYLVVRIKSDTQLASLKENCP
ncbi:hypothetical protein E1B28_005949 [Marasmius oreades]|uniref:Uncharacterized protein n=1 Tax=Marasmius oreades TaxID=181124 RepID=A0A9P7S4V5_9AGAR|nr:uncharacterized protein E1B28_005949 [Marasmius oreades]KAG7095170.1 hypothetical protein E1B28_005949 [Marasmius oreades]